MAVLRTFYRQLKPDVRLLMDEAVLAQAWKKSDGFIRRHSWYADILELECALVEATELADGFVDAHRALSLGLFELISN